MPADWNEAQKHCIRHLSEEMALSPDQALFLWQKVFAVKARHVCNRHNVSLEVFRAHVMVMERRLVEALFQAREQLHLSLGDLIESLPVRVEGKVQPEEGSVLWEVDVYATEGNHADEEPLAVVVEEFPVTSAEEE